MMTTLCHLASVLYRAKREPQGAEMTCLWYWQCLLAANREKCIDVLWRRGCLGVG